jgi:hypothetical protein
MTAIFHILRFEIPQTHALSGVRGADAQLHRCLESFVSPVDPVDSAALTNPV